MGNKKNKLPDNYRIDTYCYDAGTGWGDDRYGLGLFVWEARDIKRMFRKAKTVTGWWLVNYVTTERDVAQLKQTAWLRYSGTGSGS